MEEQEFFNVTEILLKYLNDVYSDELVGIFSMIQREGQVLYYLHCRNMLILNREKTFLFFKSMPKNVHDDLFETLVASGYQQFIPKK